jgi:murein L,D-transpeptidase YafK
MKTPFKPISLFLLFSVAFLSFAPGKRTNNKDFYFNKESTRHVPKANPYYIIISKKSYELRVYDDKGWYATYPCVFGSSDFRDKYMEGDKRTPEGNFKIILKRNDSKWKYELLLNYPDAESYKKFDERKAEGLIPRNAKIGGGIAIHATRPQEEWTVDYYQNWTDGCISLKYREAADLYSYIPVGTPVTIEK